MPNTRFPCDEMLAGLAKWLRAAGHDAADARRTAKSLSEYRVEPSDTTGARRDATLRVG